MPPLTIMLKPASSLCNLNCSYCFYKDVAASRLHPSFGLMSCETLNVLLEKAFSYASDWLTIAFQGGEPTLAGLDFYKNVITLANKYNIHHLPVHYSIQTNGYLLNEDWISFFCDNHFLVGLSVDGIIHTHNIYRKDTWGKDTFLEVMKTADLMSKHGVNYNILTVVTDKVASSIQKIYKFYKKKGFQFLQFIPCIRHFDVNSPNLLSKEAYGSFLCNLFDLWYEDIINGRMVSIRQFENYIMLLKGYPPESCDMTGHCSIQYIVEGNGDIYPCDFYVLDEYKLGNIIRDSFKSIQSSPVSGRFLMHTMNNHPDCAKCEYNYLCRGGCHRFRHMAIANEPNFYCESYKCFFAYSYDRMSKLCRLLR